MSTVAIEAYRELDVEPVQFVSSISAEDAEQCWRLRNGQSEVVARVAASCLLTPGVGDQVLAVRNGEDCWILAVLERSDTSMASIETEGDLLLRSRSGRVHIQGEAGIDVQSSGTFDLRAGRLKFAARMADMLTEKLSWIGDEMTASFRSGSVVGRAFSGVLERLNLKARVAHREVTELDQIRSGNLDYRAEQTMNFQARNVLTKAEELAKVDGGHIQLG